MGKFFVDGKETDGPEDWKVLHPERHWKTGYSAKALAYSWGTANGFPIEVREVFRDAQFGNVELLMAFPEYRTPLPGGSRPSQTDLFVLAEDAGDLIVVGVEGKVSEDFDKLVEDWLGDAPTPGQERRLSFLKRKLQVEDSVDVGEIRYQLLHRTAAALIEAERFRSSRAVMLVHSFSQEDEHFEDYRDFLDLLGCDGDDAIPNSVTPVGSIGEIDLFLAWVRGDARFLRV